MNQRGREQFFEEEEMDELDFYLERRGQVTVVVFKHGVSPATYVAERLWEELEASEKRCKEMEEALHRVLHDCAVLADYSDIARHAADPLNHLTGWTIKVEREEITPIEAKTYEDPLRNALEAARLDLTALHGLYAYDGAAPEETWQLDNQRVIGLLDDALIAYTESRDSNRLESSGR